MHYNHIASAHRTFGAPSTFLHQPPAILQPNPLPPVPSAPWSLLRQPSSILLPKVPPSIPSLPVPCAQFVSDNTITISATATPKPPGTDDLRVVTETHDLCTSLTTKEQSCALNGGDKSGACPAVYLTSTPALAVAAWSTEPTFVISRRRRQALTLLKTSRWGFWLRRHSLEDKYPFIAQGLQLGFHVGISNITRTQAPPNHSSLSQHTEAFQAVLDKGF